MKKIVIVMLGLLITTGGMFAQRGANVKLTPEERADRVTRRMSKQLLLTSDQQNKVKEIVLGFERRNSDLRQSNPNDKEAFRAEMKNNRKDMATQMRMALTPEQYDKWMKIRAKRRHIHGPPRQTH